MRKIRIGVIEFLRAADLIISRLAHIELGDHATNMPSTIRYGNTYDGKFVLCNSLKYAYDSAGNITAIYEQGILVVTYAYDKLNRLVRENNKKMNLTKIYAYDNHGNIIMQQEYAYTLKATEELGEGNVIKKYYYDMFSDQLLRVVKFTLNASGDYTESVEKFVYDAIGNPTTYRGRTLTWGQGGRLTSYLGAVFTYDARGRRLSKNNTAYTYDSQGRLVKQSNGLTFFYDHTGVAGCIYNGQYYVYRKDAQGNIIAILDRRGNVVVEYNYDAWGRNTCIDNTTVNLGTLNPFRYRGYYFDTEIGLYYLKTRYYDPAIGRFISIDGIEYLDAETVNGLNLYAYCNNNPVMNIDPNGNKRWSWKKFWRGVGMIVTAVGAVVLSVTTFGAGTPLAMSIVAGVTLSAGVLTGINGVATLVEGMNGGYNFIRDGLFNEGLGLSDNAYNTYSGVVEGIAIIGSAVLGVYNMTGRAKAARYGREFLGKGYSKVAKGRWASADGLRQMIFDNTHHLLDGVRTNTHFNLYTHATNFLKGKSTIIAKLHVFYDLFKIWFR